MRFVGIVLASAIILLSWRVSTAQSLGYRTNKDFSKLAHGRLPFNANSCANCHSLPFPGGSSKAAVMRLGFRESGGYVGAGLEGIDHVHDETMLQPKHPISGLRVTLDLLGDGYIEAIPDSEFRTLAAREAKETGGIIHGELTEVTLPEAAKSAREVGRFGWKDQHGSLISAAAEALRNELGVPNEYYPAPLGAAHLNAVSLPAKDSSQIDHIRALVAFIRSTEPIAPDPERSLLPEVIAGSQLFDRIGCSICHVRTLTTAPPGTKMLDGTLTVSSRLGNREIHPFSDFLLHDVGTGDGIVQNVRPQDYDETTANKFRTPPLWGLRYRSWMMHDGKAITYHQAIMRHGGEAKGVVEAYERLTPKEQEELREFLNSL
jgi:CxxC motif-containing protein (DUF1111 family)